MSAIASTPIDAEAKNAPGSGLLFFLDLSGGRTLSANPDGSDLLGEQGGVVLRRRGRALDRCDKGEGAVERAGLQTGICQASRRSADLPVVLPLSCLARKSGPKRK